MKFTIRHKLILSNIITITLSLLIIATIVIQGMLYYNIRYSKSLLMENSNNANLFIQQYILSLQERDNESKIAIYKENADYLAEELTKQNNIKVQLFNRSGDLIADSSSLDNPSKIEEKMEERNEIDIALHEKEKAYVVKKLEEGRYMYFASPIVMENQQIGILSFVYSLENIDTLISQSLTLFIIAGITGLIIMYFVSLYFSKRILRPVYRLIASSERIAAGNYEQEIDYISHDEIGNLTKSFNKMVANIREKIDEIHSEKKKLEAVLSSIEDGVIAVDNEKQLLTLNDPAKKIFHIDPKNEVKSIFSYEFMEELYEEVKNKQQGITKEICIENRCLLIYTNMIHHTTSNPIGCIFVIRDITKIRALEEKERQFVSSVSHELRTPLTTIMGYSDMLKRRGVENTKLVEKSINLINKEGDRLLRLVNDLLNLSKLEDMEFDLVKSQIDLIALLDEVVNQMQLKGRKYNNEIQFSYSELPNINGDYDRLKQVFINIIDNSIKYSNAGDLIQIYAEQDNDFAIVSVRDFGSGMSKEDIEKIFEPFYRIDKVRSRNLGGSGLGLAIVKEIVEKHEGIIDIESKIDEGTLITVRLPIV